MDGIDVGIVFFFLSPKRSVFDQGIKHRLFKRILKVGRIVKYEYWMFIIHPLILEHYILGSKSSLSKVLFSAPTWEFIK